MNYTSIFLYVLIACLYSLFISRAIDFVLNKKELDEKNKLWVKNQIKNH